LALALALLLARSATRTTRREHVIRFSVILDGQALPRATDRALAISPDGARLVYAARDAARDSSELYVRELDRLEPVKLAGTLDARIPVFSPDGAWIAFGAGRALHREAATGGGAVSICD